MSDTIIIGTCSLCGGDVSRELNVDIEDECSQCGALRKSYVIEMEFPKSVYDRIESTKPRLKRSILDWEDVYNVAVY